MSRQTIIIVAAVSICLPMPTQAQAKSNDNAGVPTVTVTKLNVSDKALEVSYQIKNTSEQDIWLCERINLPFLGFGIGMAKDGQTLLVSRLLSAPQTGSGPPLSGRYVPIRAGESRKESLLLSLPVRPFRVVWRTTRQPSHNIEYAKRLVIELGWYEGDFPGRVFGMLDEAEKNHYIAPQNDWGVPLDVIGWLGDSVRLNRLNESVPDRNEEFLIPWTKRTLKGEHVLRVAVDDLHIPYIEGGTSLEFRPQNLNLCTRIEIAYLPSMLEYLFAYPSQLSLLNADEANYLQSEKEVVLDDPQSIKVLTDGLKEGTLGATIVAECSKRAHVVCYNEGERLTAFTLYDERAVVTEQGQCFWYRDGLQSVKKLNSQIEQASPFRRRIDCAGNLRTLWRRLRLYHRAKQMRYTYEGGIQVAEPIPPQYPIVDQWCDSLVQAYVPLGGSEAYLLEVHKCPTEGNWKFYAMNPNCKPNSPPDMVLLFEANSGKNKYGGPELFTFDDHDPKGGCVLLNDGTVKFIRTKEELRQLRWKEK